MMRRFLALALGLFLTVAHVNAAVCPASSSNTVVTSGSTAVINDTIGGFWGLPGPTAQVFLNGSTLPWTANATQLAYVNSVVWYKNTTNQWFSFNTAGAIASGPTTTSPLTASGPVPITAPLATATAGTWVHDQHFAWPSSPSGLGYLVYGYLLPQGYDPVHFTYPVLFTGGGDGQSMNGAGGTYPTPGATFVNNTLAANYNTVAFRKAHPAIVVYTECDQSAGSSSTPNGNCGGFNDSAMSSWNEQAINGLMASMLTNSAFSITPGQHLFAGMSLSGIGYLAQLVDNNAITPVGSGLWTAGVSMSAQLFRPGTPNANVFSRMTNVPYLEICSPGDNACNYGGPLCQSITGSACTQTKTQYDSGGVAAVRAGTSQFYYISSTNGGTAYGVFGPMNEDGGDGSAIYNWLFAQVAGPVAPPPPVTGSFSVSGGYLIDPTGAKFIPEGTGIYDFNASDSIGSLAIMQGTTGNPLKTVMPKANYVRVMVFPTNINATSFTFNPVSFYTTIAADCLAAHIVCEFEDHSSNGGTWETGTPGGIAGQNSYPPTGAMLTSNLTFWAAMANQFKNNPYVFFGTLNELNSFDGSYSLAGLASISTYELAFYNNIRAQGANNIVDLQAGQTGNQPGTMGPNSGLSVSGYGSMTNIIYREHFYGDGLTAAQYQTTLTGNLTSPQGGGFGCAGIVCQQSILSKDGKVPVIINEWGPGFTNTDPSLTSGQALATAMTNLQSIGVGSAAFLWWDPNGVANYTQVNNGGTKNSTYSLTTWGGIANAVFNANPFPGGNGPGVNGETLGVNTIAPVAQNTTFTVTGSISGVSAAPTLQYADNGSGVWVAFPAGASVLTGSFSFSHPGMASNPAAVVAVRDANNTAISATGPPFVISGAASPNGTVITPGVGTFTDGTNTFSIVVAGTAGANQVYENGTGLTNGQGTVKGEWFNGLSYFQDGSTGNWFTWTLALGFTAAPAPGTVVINEAFSINAIASPVAANTPLTVSGSISGLSSAPVLQYQNNSGAWLPLPGTSSAIRNPYNQPGGSGSVWNTAFGSGSTWTNSFANNICNVNLNGGTCTGNINTVANFGITEYIGKSTDPTFSFTSSSNGRTIAPDNGATLTATMHVPAGAISGGPYANPCFDCNLVLMDPTSFPNRQYTWGGQNIPPPGLVAGQGPFTSFQAEWDDVTSDLYGQDYDSGLSGTNVGVGLINACDVTASCNPFYPEIKHGFRISIGIQQVASNAITGSKNVLGTSGWPDRLEDFQSGVTTYTGTMPFGLTLGIPLTTAMPAGLDTNCQGFFWSLQHYPTIMRDTNASGVNYYTDQVGDTSAYLTSVRGCIAKFTGLLQVLTNQHLGGQSFTTNPSNGPGTRIDTGPLPLTSTGGGTVTSLTFSFTDPGFTPGPGNTVSIRDANNITASATSNSFTVGGGTQSPNNTVVTSVAGSIVDAGGITWTITAGGQVAINGITDTSTSGVVELAYVNSVVWYEGAGNLWRRNVTAVAGAWLPVGGTLTSPLTIVESVNGSTVTTVGPVLTDLQGNTFALVTGARVSVNGAAGVNTNIVQLAYVNHVLWQESNALLWSSYSNGVWSATTSTSPLLIEAVTVNTILAQPAGVSFPVTGTVANVNSTPTLQYQDNSGAWQAFPTGSTVTLQGNGTPTFQDFFTSLDISDTGGPPAGLPVVITASPTGQSFVDNAAAVWTIVGGVAKKAGVTAGTNSSVAEIALVGSTVWYENTSLAWFSWSGTAWVAGVNPLLGGVTGMWMNHYSFGGSEYTLSFNNELEYYSSITRAPFWQPFSLQNGGAGPGLVITVDTTPQASFLAGHTPANPLSLGYNTGQINSSTENNNEPAPGIMGFQYGYVEIQALLPGGSGEWVGYALYPFTGSGELDIIETGGSNLTQVNSSLHSSTVGVTNPVAVTDYTVNRHIYGVDWQPTFITWYVDHVQTAQIATPTDFIGKAYYLSLEIAIQGNPSIGFDGIPTASTVFPAQMSIDWVKLWPNFAASQTLIAGTTASWTFSHPPMTASSTNTISVRDAANINVSDASPGFSVTTTEALSINPVGGQTAGASFTVAGIIANAGAIPTLQYQDNNGAWLAMPAGAVVTLTNFNFVNPGLSVNAAATVNVRDANTPTITASATFSVTSAVTGVGWNNADTSPTISLTNTALTATSTSAVQGGSRALASRTTGKFCFDTTLNTVTPNMAVGLSNLSFALASTTNGVVSITASPAGQSFVDGAGNTWTISAANNNGEAFENGAPPNAQFSSNVIQLELISGVIWQQNTSAQWYTWSGTAWVASNAAPTVGTTTSALGINGNSIGFYPATANAPQTIFYNGVKILTSVLGKLTPTSGGSLTDNLGHIWTLSTGSQVFEDGTLVPNSNGTGVFAIVNGLYYGQDTQTGNWFTFSLVTQTWSAATAPVIPTASVPDVSGDPVTTCVDVAAHLEWVSTPVMRAVSGVTWNSASLAAANPATGVGGVSFSGLTCPCFPTMDTSDTGTKVTLNATGPLSVTLPTGFLVWQPVVSIIHHPVLINLGQLEPANDNVGYIPARFESYGR